MDIYWFLSLKMSCIRYNISVHFHIVLLWDLQFLPYMIPYNSIYTTNPFTILALYLQSNTCWKISIITSWITSFTTFHIELSRHANITFMQTYLFILTLVSQFMQTHSMSCTSSLIFSCSTISLSHLTHIMLFYMTIEYKYFLTDVELCRTFVVIPLVILCSPTCNLFPDQNVISALRTRGWSLPCYHGLWQRGYSCVRTDHHDVSHDDDYLFVIVISLKVLLTLNNDIHKVSLHRIITFGFWTYDTQRLRKFLMKQILHLFLIAPLYYLFRTLIHVYWSWLNCFSAIPALHCIIIILVIKKHFD